MPVAEIAFGITVIALVAQVISAYRDGDSVFQQVKRKRRERRAVPPPNHLESSLQQSPVDIEREQERGSAIFGDAFNVGDQQAIIEIQQILIQLQGSMLQGLRHAAIQDDFEGFMALAHDADMARNRMVGVLIGLQQRLMIESAPVMGMPFVSPGPVRQALPMAEMRMHQAAPSMIAGNYAASRQYAPVQAERRDSFGDPIDEPIRAGNPVSANRSHFGLFRKNPKQRQASQGNSPELDKAGMQRVYTIPTNSNDEVNRSPVNNNNPPSPQLPVKRTPTFNYEDWEDDPAAIWGNPTSKRQSAFSPPARNAEPKPASLAPSSRTSTSRSSASIAPHPTSMNKYLGYCKGAVRLQNGESKAMSECRDFTSTAQSTAKFLRCSDCHFQSPIVDTKTYNRKVFMFSKLGIQARWAFLAKSHVKQTSIPDRGTAKSGNFCFQCLFCVFSGEENPVIQGVPQYMQHIHQHHRGAALSDVVLDRTSCIADRICDPRENFDINLFPVQSGEVFEVG